MKSAAGDGYFVDVNAATTKLSCKSSESTQLLHICRRNGNVERCWDATIPTLLESFDGLSETSLTANCVFCCLICTIDADPELDLQSLDQLKRCTSEKDGVGDNGCPHPQRHRSIKQCRKVLATERLTAYEENLGSSCVPECIQSRHRFFGCEFVRPSGAGHRQTVLAPEVAFVGNLPVNLTERHSTPHRRDR